MRKNVPRDSFNLIYYIIGLLSVIVCAVAMTLLIAQVNSGNFLCLRASHGYLFDRHLTRWWQCGLCCWVFVSTFCVFWHLQILLWLSPSACLHLILRLPLSASPSSVRRKLFHMMLCSIASCCSSSGRLCCCSSAVWVWIQFSMLMNFVSERK